MSEKRLTRSGELLARLLDTGEFTEEELGRELMVTADAVRQFRSGETVLPLSRQLLLAKLVIARSATLRRLGHALQAQVVAATGFKNKDVTAQSGPHRSWRPR